MYGLLDFPALFGLAPVLALPESLQVEFEASARRIVTESRPWRPGYTLAAGGECARLLAYIWRETLDQCGGMARHDITRAVALAQFAAVFLAIQAHHSEPLRVRDLARMVNLHPAWFSTRFKQLTGLFLPAT